MPPVRNAPSDTQTKRARKKPTNYNPRIGKSGELAVTPHPNNGSGSAKRKRQTSILEGAQDAMADATAGAMSLDIRDAPGSRKKAGVKLRKQTSDEAESEKEPDGEEEQDGEEEAEDGIIWLTKRQRMRKKRKTVMMMMMMITNPEAASPAKMDPEAGPIPADQIWKQN